jgi:hypothetical protein
MSGASTRTGEPASLTEVYLDFAEHGAAPMGDSELVIDEWPNKVQTTLGWEESRAHGKTPPQIVGAAAVAAAVTHIAAGKYGAENVARHPTFGWFGRSRTFAGFLHSLNSGQRFEGQGPGLYVVANFCDPRTPLLRTSTAPHGVVGATLKGHSVKGREAAVIQANDELYLGSSIGRIKEMCVQALHNVLHRDYGLKPHDEDTMRIFSRWAIVKRMGDSMHGSSTAATVHMGQFMAACHELKAKLPRGTKLEDVLPNIVFSTYASGRDAGVAALPIREAAGDFNAVQRPRRRQRTIEDVEALLSQGAFQPQAPLIVRAANLLTPQRLTVPKGQNLDAVLERLGDQNTTCMDIRRLGRGAIEVQLGNCRDQTEQQMAIDSRRKHINHLMNRGQDLPRGGHRRGVYEDHPYLRPGAMNRIHEADTRFAEYAPNPADGVAQLDRLRGQMLTGRPVTEQEVLAAYAAAILGTPTERRAAYTALGSMRYKARMTLGAYIPMLTTRSLRDVPGMQQKYGYTYEDVMGLGIGTTQLDGELPLHLYVPAAVALFDNPDSIVPTRPRKIRARERIIRGDPPKPDDPEGSAEAVRNIKQHLYLEASSRYGVDVRLRDGAGAPRQDTLQHPLLDETTGDLLVACRLAEGMAALAAQHATVRDNLAWLIGPTLQQFNPDEVQQNMPPLVYRQFMTYLGRYNELRAEERLSSGPFGAGRRR